MARSREFSNGRMEQAPTSVLDVEKYLKYIAIWRQAHRQLLVSTGGRADRRLLRIGVSITRHARKSDPLVSTEMREALQRKEAWGGSGGRDGEESSTNRDHVRQA